MFDEEYTFSFCTLVKNRKKYEFFLDSLHQNRFSKKTDEILYLDNSVSNAHDCYSAIREFIKISTKPYLVLVHDDVVINNSREKLISEIKRIELIDPAVGVFGVAGVYKNPLQGVGHFFSTRGEENWGFKRNGRVNSLDECFLIIKKSTAICVSDGMKGFHFYGTDICINAAKKGATCYAIDYPITHLSQGNLDKSFLTARKEYNDHLKRVGYRDLVSTTCTTLYGGNSFFLHAQSEALAILKPALGENPKACYVKKQILADLGNDYVLKGAILIIYYYQQLKVRRVQIIRRFFSDIAWWSKNWRSRI